MDANTEALLDRTEDVDEPLSSNPLWDDVKPIPQNDGIHTVVNIAYTPVFREAMDFFRGVIESNELSERVLSLTKRIISLNAANYTAWHIRRQCLFKLGGDLTEEMEFVEECAENNPKNYQIWYHRRALVEKLKDGTAEPKFVSIILNSTDAKNYHAWAHRQWAISQFQIWEGELEFADYLIKNDVRNNSAWNHRWFVLTRGNTITKLEDRISRRELVYALEKAELAPSNECPYSYIRAVSSRSSIRLDDEMIMSRVQDLLARETSSSLGNLRSLLVDALLLKGESAQGLKLCLELADKYDTIRAAYWKWRAALIAAERQ